MGNDQLDPHRHYVTEFSYDLRERGDELTDEEFEKVSLAVHEWGTKADVPVEIRKNKKGFSVAITHPLENGDGFGMKFGSISISFLKCSIARSYCRAKTNDIP